MKRKNIFLLKNTKKYKLLKKSRYIQLIGIELWNLMSVATIICGVWSLSRIFSVILAGGVGKNGSTVAVSPLQSSQNKKH